MIAIIISVIAIIAVVAVDQISKYVMIGVFNVSEYIGSMDVEALEPIVEKLDSIDVIPGVFRFSLVLNDGMAFGALDNARWVFLILSTVAIVAVLGYMFWKKPQNKLLLTALVMVTGGGIGNMIDRIRFGYVIDFFDFCAFPKIWYWVFNVADSFVCVGAGLLALWLILDTVKEMKAEKLQKAAANRADLTSAESSQEHLAENREDSLEESSSENVEETSSKLDEKESFSDEKNGDGDE